MRCLSKVTISPNEMQGDCGNQVIGNQSSGNQYTNYRLLVTDNRQPIIRPLQMAKVLLSKSVLIIVILLLTFSNAFAQNNTLNLKKPLALKECIQIALENSSMLTIAKRDVVASELEVKDVRAGYLPRLDVTANYKVNDTYHKIEWTSNHYDAKLSLVETFYDNGKTPARIEQAKARLASAQLDFQKIQNELTLEVINGYYTLLKAQEMLKVKEEGLKQSQTHLNLAKARYDAGVAPKSDILKAEVEVGNSELDLIEAENTVSIALTNLNNIMGIDLNTPLLIVDIEEPPMIPWDTKRETLSPVDKNSGSMIPPKSETQNPKSKIEPIDMTIDECLDYALANRPEIKKAEISLQIDEIELGLARKEVYPGITLEGNYNINVSKLIDKNDWEESSGWEIGIKISFPIFDAGKDKRGVTKAKLNLANTKTKANQLAKDITLEVKKAYLTLKSQEMMIATSKRQMIQAQESFDAAKGRYKEGVAPITEIIDAQASFNSAKAALIKAIYDYNVAIFTLKKAIGGQMI